MISFKKIQEEDRQKGFTLIESLISITILMISVALPMTMAWSGLLAAHLAEDQIIAYYLAQDAVEYVRDKIDYNKLEETAGMLDNIFNNCKVSDTDGSGANGIDNPGTVSELGCNLSTFGPVDDYSDEKGVYNGSKLYYHADGGEYDYNSSNGTLSKFSRQVRIGYINNDLSEIIVEVKVKWPNDVGAIREFKIRSHLRNW